ncbi:Arm DNA-binding domain-containing protein [Xanthomonas sacchari]|uniref:Arm DNA-binding domain-containing protein n=1 Tax=Xanthomonas sacchari TaxID=56458 RepID=UPI00225B0188|nr:Arm DNA-binding domain-containing protein [Xanthomonas sacchari]
MSATVLETLCSPNRVTLLEARPDGITGAREVATYKGYKGLYLEIKPNGIKAWRYRFKLNDKAS